MRQKISRNKQIFLVTLVIIFISCGIGLLIYLHGEDIYIYSTDRDRKVVYWKNGKKHTLPYAPIDSRLQMNCISVSGNDIYVVGGEPEDYLEQEPPPGPAVYWKNGELYTLPSGEENRGMANSVFINGDDVYIAGNIYKVLPEDYQETRGRFGSRFLTYPVYWKNGELLILSKADGDLEAKYTGSIKVTNNNIYITDINELWSTDRRGYWKNGE